MCVSALRPCGAWPSYLGRLDVLSRVFNESSAVLGTGLGVSGFIGGLVGVLTAGPFGDWLASRDGVRGRLIATVIATALEFHSRFSAAHGAPYVVSSRFLRSDGGERKNYIIVRTDYVYVGAPARVS